MSKHKAAYAMHIFQCPYRAHEGGGEVGTEDDQCRGKTKKGFPDIFFSELVSNIIAV